MHSIKVGHNFKFYALVELVTVLLVKLNSIFLRQTLCANAFALCAKRLVKLPPRATTTQFEEDDIILNRKSCLVTLYAKGLFVYEICFSSIRGYRVTLAEERYVFISLFTHIVYA